MSETFELYTEITIEIYAPFPLGSRTHNYTKDDGLPPFLKKGILVRQNKAPMPWFSDVMEVPSDIEISEGDRAYSAHQIKVGNRLGVPGVDPCLQANPATSETLPNLYAGVPDSSAISFSLLNPRWRPFFSSAFMSSNSSVLVERISGGTRNFAWRGFINRIQFQESITTVSARPDNKRLDAKATFGFEAQLKEWEPDFKIPIVSARVLPYTIRTVDLPPQRVHSYNRWFGDFADYYRSSLRAEPPTETDFRSLMSNRFNNVYPRYVTFDKEELIKCNSTVATEYKEVTVRPMQGHWVHVNRGIFILPSEDEDPKLPGTNISPMEVDRRNFRDSLYPEDMSFDIPGAGENIFRVLTSFSQVININTGFAFCRFAALGSSNNKPSPGGFYYQTDVTDTFIGPGGASSRVAHPLDGVYRFLPILDNRVNAYIFGAFHAIDKFLKIAKDPGVYYLDRWVSLCTNYSPISSINPFGFGEWGEFLKYYFTDFNRMLGIAGTTLPPTATFTGFDNDDALRIFYSVLPRTEAFDTGGTIRTTLRSKDLYFVESPFKSIQHSSALTDLDLAIFGLNPLYKYALLSGGDAVNSLYSGANILKVLPSFRASDRPENEDDNKIFGSPNIEYERSYHGGGAYMVKSTTFMPSDNYKDMDQAIVTAGDVTSKADIVVFKPQRYVSEDEVTIAPISTFGPSIAGAFVPGTSVGSVNLLGYYSESGITRYAICSADFFSLGNRGLDFEDRFTDISRLESLGASSEEFEATLADMKNGRIFMDIDQITNVVTTESYILLLNSSNLPSTVYVHSFLRQEGREYPLLPDRTFDFQTTQFATSSRAYTFGFKSYNSRLYIGIHDPSLQTVKVHAINPIDNTILTEEEINLDFATITLSGSNPVINMAIGYGRIYVWIKGGIIRVFSLFTGARYLYEDIGGVNDNDNVVEANAGRGLSTICINPTRLTSTTTGTNSESFKLVLITTQPGNRNNGAGLAATRTSHFYDVFEIAVPSGFSENKVPVFRPEEEMERAWKNSFSFYYHHDMYDADDAHLRPTTFIHACLINAGLTPSFKQDGSDVEGPINNHKMQLVADTDFTYRELLQRVLPGLGYIIRFNHQTGMVDLIHIAKANNATMAMGTNAIQYKDSRADFQQQYSTVVFENDDMLRGSNTLEEWRDSPQELGKFTVFNSTPFVLGRSITIKTGTWTSEFEAVATLMTIRKDTYAWRVTNFHLLSDTGNLIGPLIGDRVALISRRLPFQSKRFNVPRVNVLVTSRNQGDIFTDFQGVAFEEDES